MDGASPPLAAGPPWRTMRPGSESGMKPFLPLFHDWDLCPSCKYPPVTRIQNKEEPYLLSYPCSEPRKILLLKTLLLPVAHPAAVPSLLPPPHQALATPVVTQNDDGGSDRVKELSRSITRPIPRGVSDAGSVRGVYFSTWGTQLAEEEEEDKKKKEEEEEEWEEENRLHTRHLTSSACQPMDGHTGGGGDTYQLVYSSSFHHPNAYSCVFTLPSPPPLFTSLLSASSSNSPSLPPSLPFVLPQPLTPPLLTPFKPPPPPPPPDSYRPHAAVPVVVGRSLSVEAKKRCWSVGSKEKRKYTALEMEEQDERSVCCLSAFPLYVGLDRLPTSRRASKHVTHNTEEDFRLMSGCERRLKADSTPSCRPCVSASQGGERSKERNLHFTENEPVGFLRETRGQRSEGSDLK
ncbi:unnamed protein product [Pleuronectes platessa]|uniref:Uncharacterized protein n=1 Tax=Pleuronectes platessa TaxID=8262 RepID=A0A9N7YL93_PLEPL|nr:unnamed protein product [Pleuronectes platessa]